MRSTHDLSACQWTLTGYAPLEWQLRKSMETGIATSAEIPPVPVSVPGSVQGALRAAGLLPDWNVGLDSRACEWVENRHWIYETTIPDAWLRPGAQFRLNCPGLDYCGVISVNGQEVTEFKGTHVPHVVDVTSFLKPAGNVVQIVFTCPPRWLGQFGYTSKMTEWKPRFNYTWDWTPRVVQLGIWDRVLLEVTDGPALDTVRCHTEFDLASGRGSVRVRGVVRNPGQAQVTLALRDGDREIGRATAPATQLTEGVALAGLAVQPWWPNGEGTQPLYQLSVELVVDGRVADCELRSIGFKQVEWQACEGAPPGADPWICVVNGRPVFLQGVDWTPIRPCFADVPVAEYRKRLELYRDLGCNVLRVWGGAFLEKSEFYRLCDELGLLVWQEFPLSSSGWENWPPEDEKSIAELCEIALSYIVRRQHHACLLLWCGGNELQGTIDGGKAGCGKPVPKDHPLMIRWARLVEREDPGRRFLETSSSGPRFTADEKDFGKGLHWDVHGPWAMSGTFADWERYWRNDDSLFRSETGCPGASPVDIIEEFAGAIPVVPGTLDNPLWRRTKWWIEWPKFVLEKGREPRDLAEYVAWSQERQKCALVTAARILKAKFPRCGGLILWMGHDSYPCMANTAIVDYHGRPKPAALGLAEVFKARPGDVC